MKERHPIEYEFYELSKWFLCHTIFTKENTLKILPLNFEYKQEKQAENIKIEEENSINYEEAENNLMHTSSNSLGRERSKTP